jgi:hypothetical protein
LTGCPWQKVDLERSFATFTEIQIYRGIRRSTVKLEKAIRHFTQPGNRILGERCERGR